jgi:hypothetical protein
VNVRPYHELDRPAFDTILETCPSGAFVADPSRDMSFVVEDERGVLGAVVFRKTVEPFLYINQGLAPGERWRALQTLAEQTGPVLWAEGIREAHLFPNDDAFAWRLARKLRGAVGDLRRHLVWDLSQIFGG